MTDTYCPATGNAGDTFSWNRVGQLANYYSPVIKRQVICYLAISALFSALVLLPLPGVGQVGLFTICWTALPLLFELAPIAFAKSGDTRVIDRMVPAKASEKFVFFILYTLVIIPLCVYVLPEGALLLYTEIPSLQTSLMTHYIDMHFGNPPLIVTLNILGAAGGTLTCLFVINYARTSRVLKAVISMFAVQFAVATMGAIYGLTEVFSMGFKAGYNGDPPASQEEQQRIAKEIIEHFSEANPYLWTVVGIMAAYTALMLWLNYRTLRRRNL